MECESHRWWGTFLPNLGTLEPLGSRIIRYVREERTFRHTDGQKQRLLLPSLIRAGHNKIQCSLVLAVCPATLRLWPGKPECRIFPAAGTFLLRHPIPSIQFRFLRLLTQKKMKTGNRSTCSNLKFCTR